MDAQKKYFCKLNANNQSHKEAILIWCWGSQGSSFSSKNEWIYIYIYIGNREIIFNYNVHSVSRNTNQTSKNFTCISWTSTISSFKGKKKVATASYRDGNKREGTTMVKRHHSLQTWSLLTEPDTFLCWLLHERISHQSFL